MSFTIFLQIYLLKIPMVGPGNVGAKTSISSIILYNSIESVNYRSMCIVW